MMTDKATIHVNFRSPGRHRWPDAGGERAYLANEHRHLFHVQVSTPVGHDDRAIEFHDLRDKALEIFESLSHGTGDLGTLSCEMMAREMCRRLLHTYPRGSQFWFSVSVFEDGECGATVVA